VQLTDPSTTERASPTSDQCWVLLERVVNSPRFQKAARLREFLLYVGRRTLKEGCGQIHEQEIGSEVFGRPATYDTSVDNIVRVNATEVRKRVEAYFELEGAHESLILEIPRGSYKPVFRWRFVDLVPPEQLLSEPAPVKPEANAEDSDSVSAAIAEAPRPLEHKPLEHDKRLPQGTLLLVACGMIVLLGIGCAALWMQNRAMHRSLYAWQYNPTLRSFWSQIFEAQPNTDIVLADTSFALIEDITKKPIPLQDYLNRRYVSDLQSQNRSADISKDRRDDLNLIMARNYGSMGDFRVAQRIAAFDPLGHNIHVDYAIEYTPALVKKDTVILIGSRKSNPWVDLFASSLNFTIEYDPDRLVSFVKNRTPAPGEQPTYSAPPSPDYSSGYSIVAYLPNPGQPGKVLIIAGTGSEATEGAGEFITSEEQLARFQKMLHVDKLPYFEVLLKTTHLSATPLDATIVAYRTYPAPR